MWRRRKRERDDSPAEQGNGATSSLTSALVFVLSALAVAVVFFLLTTVELSRRDSGRRRSGRVRDNAAAARALGHTDVRPPEALEPARP